MKTLLVGYKAADLFERGKHGKKFTAKWIDGDVLCHTLDIYHRHAIEKTHHIRAVCSPHLPEGPWDLIKFKTGPKLMSGELSLDMLQEIHRLKPAKFELEFVGKERDRNELLSKIRDDPDRVRDFSAKWPASVPGGDKLMFTSYPGCFCHRRLDEGGLALAEVISRDLTSSPFPHSSFLKLLDMGCGCGLVGFLVKSVVKDISLVMVDSHSRAVEAANLNAANFNMSAEVILADNGTPARMDGTFDVFAGNPPYYSDYRIAEVFLETAKRALKPGGLCYTVVKNDAGLRPVQERYFPNVEVIRRRGYCVLKSVKA
ncbi:MAG: methyltransferase [Kiritimatiellae bacterium]|nr:methyltransferase [Kiritimatiellia bacterium]